MAIKKAISIQLEMDWHQDIIQTHMSKFSLQFFPLEIYK